MTLLIAWLLMAMWGVEGWPAYVGALVLWIFHLAFYLED